MRCAMRKACPTCTVLGADLIDPNDVGIIGQAVRQGGQADPEGLGAARLRDANPLKTSRTRKLLKAVKGAVPFTETGRVVSRNNGSG